MTTLIDHEGNQYNYDNLTQQNYLEGKPAGVEAAFQWLSAKATDLFQRGKYEEAKVLRELAVAMRDDLKPQLNEAVSAHRRLYPSHIEGIGAATPYDVMYAAETWNENDGPALWWKLPISEMPYCGTPFDEDFNEGYYTHWSKLPEPTVVRLTGTEFESVSATPV